MNYDLVPISELTADRRAAPRQLSLDDEMLRQFHLFRQRHFPSSYLRWFRYIAIALLVFQIRAFLLPSTDSTGTTSSHDGSSRISSFHIQYAFKKENSAAKQTRIDRQQEVREAFLHAWKGYKSMLGFTMKFPLTGGNKDPFVGWAAISGWTGYPYYHGTSRGIR